MSGELTGEFRAIGRRLQTAAPDGGYTNAVVDPASGALLGLYVERPDPVERVQDGEVVGYVIIAVGVLGVLLAVFQAAYLDHDAAGSVGAAAKSQRIRNPTILLAACCSRFAATASA